MAKLAAVQVDLDLNGTAQEAALTGLTFDLRQQVLTAEGLTGSGPQRVQGNYDWTISLEGSWDGASGQADDLLLGLLGSTSGWTDLSPAGTTASPSTPLYDGGVLLGRYTLRASSRSGTKYGATLEGNGALLRAVDLSFVLDSQAFGLLDTNELG